MKTAMHWMACLIVLSMSAASLAAEQPKADQVAAAPLVDTFGVYGRSILSAMVALTDETIAEELRTLKVLAENPAVRGGQWEPMRDLLKSSQPTDALGMIWFAQPSGAYYTLESGPATQSLQDRPYFPDLMRGQVVPGSLVVSRASGKKSLVVAVPVRDGEKVIGALGVSIFLDRLSEKINRGLSLPPCMVFYCLNTDGKVILHRDPRYIFEDPAKLGSETLRVAEAEMLARDAVEVSYEFAGYKRRVVCQASPVSKWRFAIGVNTGLATAAAAR